MTDVRESNLRGSRADKRPLKAVHNEGGRGGRRRGGPGARARVGDPEVGSVPGAPCWSQDAVLEGWRTGPGGAPRPGRSGRARLVHVGRAWRVLSQQPGQRGDWGKWEGCGRARERGTETDNSRQRETLARKTGRKNRGERAGKGGTDQETETEMREPGNDLRKAQGSGDHREARGKRGEVAEGGGYSPRILAVV